jgi:hypothetical protein
MRKICLYELKYSDKICYTAITFFRRFFFKNSSLEFDPFHISMVCIYLAAKVEERADLKPLPQFVKQHFSNTGEYFGLTPESNPQ